MYFKVPTNPQIIESPTFYTRPFVSGFEMLITGATTLTLNPGCARNVATPGTITYPSAQPNLPGVITVDVSTLFVPGAAVGGCFPLPLPQAGLASNDTVFPVFVIGDSTGSNPTIAIIPTGSAFLPAGYDTFCRVAEAYVDGSTFHLISVNQTGHYEVRDYQLAASVNVLTAGAATSATLVNLTSGDRPIVPGATSKVKLLVTFTPNAQADAVFLNSAGFAGAPIILQASAATKTTFFVEMLPGIDATTGDAGIDYHVSAGTDAVNIDVIGWTDDMAVAIN